MASNDTTEVTFYHYVVLLYEYRQIQLLLLEYTVVRQHTKRGEKLRAYVPWCACNSTPEFTGLQMTDDTP